MNRKFSFSTGEFYHIYNRGTEKRKIFLEKNDWQRFEKLLYLCNSKNSIVFRDVPKDKTYKHNRNETLVDIGAYCLMPNHFHLLLHEKIDGGISIFMQKISTAYSAYFNKKYGRSGSLFEGVFKATHVDIDEYLKYLFSYIHLNPIKIIDPKWKENGIADHERAKRYLKEYIYSSYPDHIGVNREEGAILNKSAFPEYFADLKEFGDIIDEWLSFKDLELT